jgi:branched-chain amino acid transport system permease protein
MFWFLLVLMDTSLRQALSAGYISDSILESSDIGPLRFAVVGLLLMLIMIYRPQGVLGSRREMLLRDR